MNMGVSVKMDLRHPSELDILGQVLMNVILFFESNFDQEKLFEDFVLLDKAIPASELFRKENNIWYLQSESLPADMAIKSIGVDDNTLYLELAPLYNPKVRNIIKAYMLPLKLKGNKVIDTASGATLVEIGGIKRPKFDDTQLGSRCLWTIPIKKLDATRKTVLLNFIDRVYTIGAFVPEDEVVDEEDAATSGPKNLRLELRLNLQFQLRLEREQQPLLSGRPRAEAQLQIQQIVNLSHAILNMTSEELLDFIIKSNEERGEKATTRILHFTLAGKIKRIKPSLTWKEARERAWKLASKQPVA